MNDIDLSFTNSNDQPSKISIMEDMDIFSGGHDTKTDSSHIPKISEVESHVRIKDEPSNSGLMSKVTNLFGFNVDAEPMAPHLRTNIDEIRSGTPRTDYQKLSSAAVRTNIPAKPTRAKVVFSKRHLLEKIEFYIRALNEIRETKTSSEITAHSSFEEIRAEYEELRDEYHMASAIQGYRSSIIEGAAYLESFGSVVDLPLNTDGLESAISLSMRDCGEQFEQIYEEYGAIKVNPLISVGFTVLSTVIKTHLLQTAMNSFGPSIADDPEINDILDKRAKEMGERYANQSVPDMVSSMKKPPKEEFVEKETQFKHGFHFADPLIKENREGAMGPPPPIHTKITKPPATEETVEQIKKMSSTLLSGEEEGPRIPMKGPGTTVNMSNFLESIKVPQPPAPSTQVLPEKKKGRGRKANSTVSIDI
jgi:hypothetical protein